MAEHAPDLPCGLPTDAYRPKNWQELAPEICDRLREISDHDRIEVRFISHQCKNLSRPRMRELKSRGTAVRCWTITSPEVEREERHVAENITFEDHLA